MPDGLRPKCGWRVEKSPERYQHHNNQGGLQLLNGNIVINGVNFDLTSEQVIAICQNQKSEVSPTDEG